MKDQLQKGFPLEKPDTLLEWNVPLGELAAKTGGVLNGDRYYWAPSVYLSGLKYLLSSENGLPDSTPFTSITAYAGLNKDSEWDTEVSLLEYDKITVHLTKLFGEPYEVNPVNDNGEKSQSWKVGRIALRLSVIEHFALKCFLTISIE